MRSWGGGAYTAELRDQLLQSANSYVELGGEAYTAELPNPLLVFFEEGNHEQFWHNAGMETHI